VGSQARKLSREQEKARRRTLQGVCSRCGRGVKLHPNGNCPDGGGSYTWAMTREDIDRMEANFEQAKAKVGKIHLTVEEQRVLDVVADRFMAGEGSRPSEIAELCQLPLHTARAVLESLQRKGMLGKPGPAPS
jgi:hypothetical protein